MRISNAVAPTLVEVHLTGNAELHSPRVEKFERHLPEWPYRTFGVSQLFEHRHFTDINAI